jgi:hypothetical protein
LSDGLDRVRERRRSELGGDFVRAAEPGCDVGSASSVGEGSFGRACQAAGSRVGLVQGLPRGGGFKPRVGGGTAGRAALLGGAGELDRREFGQ